MKISFRKKLFDNQLGKSGRLYIFIDSSNLWAAQKSKGKLFDYQKLVGYIKAKFQPTELDVFYYAAYPADGTRNYSLDNRHKFFTYLKKGLGFTVRKKELKRIKIIDAELGEGIKEKGDMDVEIAVDAMHHKNKYDTAIFFTGDSDFLVLINYLRKAGKKIYVFSSKNNISEELRTSADGYCDVIAINDIWGKELKRRQK
ncbi:MAG: NYN domain-containing protein [Candidatus Falkowbacteria bacterium]